VRDAETVMPPSQEHLAYITQTTLSVDDTADIVAALRARFPAIAGPAKEDICYATTNRQAAVKAIAPDCDLVLVIGSANSSNSQRLREVAVSAGAGRSILIPDCAALDWTSLDGVSRLGVTAGASAPESLVEALLARLRERYVLAIEERVVTTEDVVFKLPRALS
jgi:4-hydroxy-3-methylbut-2-enyl diphosphate reductase